MKPVLSKSIAVSDNRGVFSASSLPEDGEWIQTNVSYNLKAHTFLQLIESILGLSTAQQPLLLKVWIKNMQNA